MSWQDFVASARKADALAAQEQAREEAEEKALKAKQKKESSPFFFISAIKNRRHVMTESNQKHYVPFLCSRAMSNSMQNLESGLMGSMLQMALSGLPDDVVNRLHYEYMHGIVRPGNVKEDWSKFSFSDELDLIMDVYKVDSIAAEGIRSRLTDSDYAKLKEWYDNRHGGRI